MPILMTTAMLRRTALPLIALAALTALQAASVTPAHAAGDAVAVDTLRRFVREVRSARADFTQTVTSPDGKKVRQSQGTFAFQRPDRFRFHYVKPYEQLIVGDGRQVWLYDADLNQVTVRPIGEALGATPAALLAGKGLDADFTLRSLPAAPAPAGDAALQWAEAVPRQKDSAYQAIRVGFRSGTLAALEIVDGFGQRSRLEFSGLKANDPLPPAAFTFKPPAGAEVIEAIGSNR